MDQLRLAGEKARESWWNFFLKKWNQSFPLQEERQLITGAAGKDKPFLLLSAGLLSLLSPWNQQIVELISLNERSGVELDLVVGYGQRPSNAKRTIPLISPINSIAFLVNWVGRERRRNKDNWIDDWRREIDCGLGQHTITLHSVIKKEMFFFFMEEAAPFHSISPFNHQQKENFNFLFIDSFHFVLFEWNGREEMKRYYNSS